MLFMNEWEIETMERRYADHPILGPATQTLANLKDWTNRNSDGWAYWPKPCRAAKTLQDLIQQHDRFDRNSAWHLPHAEATVESYKAALRPIKAFRTRQGATFEIVEVAA